MPGEHDGVAWARLHHGAFLAHGALCLSCRSTRQISSVGVAQDKRLERSRKVRVGADILKGHMEYYLFGRGGYSVTVIPSRGELWVLAEASLDPSGACALVLWWCWAAPEDSLCPAA